MITFLQGNAVTDPRKGATAQHPAIIAHICNNVGSWGAGFVVPLGVEYPQAKTAYLNWSMASAMDLLVAHRAPFELGQVQLVPTAHKHVWVANMVAQDNTGPQPPVSYDALSLCLLRVGGAAQALNASVHMPRIGCGIGGGTWDKIEPLINRHMTEHHVPVYVYDLPPHAPMGKHLLESTADLVS